MHPVAKSAAAKARLVHLAQHLNSSTRSSSHMAENLVDVQKLFLSAPKYAVVGASKDRLKYGNKVLRWYQTRDIDVTAVHPTEEEVEGVKAVSALENLPSPSETSVSIITPPKVTLSILQSAKALNIPALWLQPGAEDDAVREYVQEAGLEDRVILGGPCILVDGDGIRADLRSESKD